jgi:hypothetical protein
MFKTHKWIRAFIQGAYGKWLLLTILFKYKLYSYERYLNFAPLFNWKNVFLKKIQDLQLWTWTYLGTICSVIENKHKQTSVSSGVLPLLILNLHIFTAGWESNPCGDIKEVGFFFLLDTQVYEWVYTIHKGF